MGWVGQKYQHTMSFNTYLSAKFLQRMRSILIPVIATFSSVLPTYIDSTPSTAVTSPARSAMTTTIARTMLVAPLT